MNNKSVEKEIEFYVTPFLSRWFVPPQFELEAGGRYCSTVDVLLDGKTIKQGRYTATNMHTNVPCSVAMSNTESVIKIS